MFPALSINQPEGPNPLPSTQLATVPSPSTAPPSSPLWWLGRLDAKLRARATGIQIHEGYYDGSQPLAFATDQFKRAFGDTFKAFADNWMQIVVDSVEERLDPRGFRVPLDTGDAMADAEALVKGDRKAWDMWQAANLDANSSLVHQDALIDRVSYAIVGPGGEYPEITNESALEVICESMPGYRNRRLAALKRWQDDSGFVFATVYLTDGIYKFRSSRAVAASSDQVTWVERHIIDEPWPVPNTIGIVPVVPFPNKPRTLREGQSEIAQLTPIQDGINKLFMDMLVASEYGGFMQRWAAGIELPIDPKTNQPLDDAWKFALDRFIHSPDAEATFGTFAATDLANYTGAIAMAIQHLASRSSTPPHYFLANMGNFPSGEALKAAETGLVSKVTRRQKHFGEAWEEVMRLAFLTVGDEQRAAASLAGEVIWKDPESRTESEHIDALVKLGSLGVPKQILWEKSGWFSPQEIERMSAMIAAGAETIQPPPAPSNGAPSDPNGPQDGMMQANDAAMAQR